MEKTRKAFVVLAAAVTAGNYIGCGSNDPAEQDAQLADDASTTDAQGPDAATPMDTQAVDATPRTDVQAVADLGQESVIVNTDASVPSPDTRPGLTMPAGTLYDVLVRNDVA